MLEECVMAAIHFVPSLGMGVGVGGLASDNFGRPDVPEVSLQPLRGKSDHENPASIFLSYPG